MSATLAHHLALVFERAGKFDAHDGQPAMQVWQKVFGAKDAAETRNQLRSVRKALMRLFEVVEEGRDGEIRPSSVKKVLPAIRAADRVVSLSVENGPWKDIRSVLSSAQVVDLLQLTDDILLGRISELVLSKESVQALRDTIGSALSEVRTSSLDPRLKARLMHYLKAVLDALDYYDLYGPELLEDAIESASGFMVLHLDRNKADADPAISKFRTVIISAVTVVRKALGLTSDAAGTIEAMHSVHQLLQPAGE